MIDLFLLVCVIANGCIIGHIAGAKLGEFLAKVVVCFIGVQVKISSEKTGRTELMTFKGREAWTVQSDFERIRRYARDNQAAGR